MAATALSTTSESSAAILASLGLGGGAKSASSTSSSSSANSATDQQSKFLTLLTTQLKNQDPLNPMDNAQMTSQLAQISTVDGIERLNKTLSSLIDNSNSAQVMQAAAMVGHGVLVAGSHMTTSENGGVAGYELAGPADTVKIEINDSNGILMRTMTLSGQKAGVNSFTWDGKTDAGDASVPGKYNFKVTATQGSNTVKADRLELAPVTGVIRSGSGSTASAQLSVGNLGNFDIKDIKQIF